MRSVLVCLIISGVAFGQTTDDQRILIPTLTQADLDALPQRLLLNDAEMIRKAQKMMEDEAFRKEVLKKIPPEILGKIPEPMRMLQSKPGNPFRDSTPVPERSPWGAQDRSSPPPSSSRSPQDPRLQNNPSVQNAIKFWEKNIGPLEKTPALRKAMADLMNSSLSRTGSGESLLNDERLNSLLDPETPIGRELGDWLSQAANSTSWNFSDRGLGDWNLRLPETNFPSSGIGRPSFSTSGTDSGSPLLLPLLLIALAVVVGVAYLRAGSASKKQDLSSKRIVRADAAGVVDRATLVAAFESSSLNTLGEDARTWNHRTIAMKFIRNGVAVATASEAAGYYEIARYAPQSETLSLETLARARHCLSLLTVAPQS